MLGSWRRRKDGEGQSTVSADFTHALTREILRTELLRIRTILATLAVLLAMTIAVMRFRRTLD